MLQIWDLSATSTDKSAYVTGLGTIWTPLIWKGLVFTFLYAQGTHEFFDWCDNYKIPKDIQQKY